IVDRARETPRDRADPGEQLLDVEQVLVAELRELIRRAGKPDVADRVVVRLDDRQLEPDRSRETLEQRTAMAPRLERVSKESHESGMVPGTLGASPYPWKLRSPAQSSANPARASRPAAISTASFISAASVVMSPAGIAPAS